jgi:hypothetical protein
VCLGLGLSVGPTAYYFEQTSFFVALDVFSYISCESGMHRVGGGRSQTTDILHTKIGEEGGEEVMRIYLPHHPTPRRDLRILAGYVIVDANSTVLYVR